MNYYFIGIEFISAFFEEDVGIVFLVTLILRYSVQHNDTMLDAN